MLVGFTSFTVAPRGVVIGSTPITSPSVLSTVRVTAVTTFRSTLVSFYGCRSGGEPIDWHHRDPSTKIGSSDLLVVGPAHRSRASEVRSALSAMPQRNPQPSRADPARHSLGLFASRLPLHRVQGGHGGLRTGAAPETESGTGNRTRASRRMRACEHRAFPLRAPSGGLRGCGPG